ncbi:MAG: DUF885 domain-containing protein, partial [bacterium]
MKAKRGEKVQQGRKRFPRSRRGAPLKPGRASGMLYRLFENEWGYRMEQNPTWASVLGDRRWNDRWDEVSPAAFEKRNAHHQAVLKKLRTIDRKALSLRNRLNYDLFKREYETEVEGNPYRGFLIPVNQRNGVQTANELADSLRFETLKDYDDWVARLHAFPAYLDQTTALMREGIRSKIILPKIILQRIPAQIDKQIVSKGEESLFFKPLRDFPPQVSESDRPRLVREAVGAIEKGIVPAFEQFKRYFMEEYLPAGFDEVGIWQLPDGEAMYAYSTRRNTTTSMTPKVIHEVGLSEVARIRAGM